MNDKQKKPQKLKARLPRGFVDRTAGDIRAVNEMTAKIREVYEHYGFDPLETPLFEYTDALGKFLPDVDRPNEGVFSLKDDDDQWMSLRYDLTAPLARHVAANFQNLAKPFRRYQTGTVWRNEKPGPGRYREFTQFDADTVGTATAAADAELLMMLSDTLEALGIPRGGYIIKLNNRKLLDGVLEVAGIPLEDRERRGNRHRQQYAVSDVPRCAEPDEWRQDDDVGQHKPQDSLGVSALSGGEIGVSHVKLHCLYDK